jgi:hypothetical protein
MDNTRNTKHAQMEKHAKHLHLFLNGSTDQLSEGLEELESLDGINGYSVEGYTESPFCGLHPEAIRMIKLPDENFLGLRASHFVLIFGTSEAIWSQDKDFVTDQDCVALLANHKGGLMIKVFFFNDR